MDEPNNLTINGNISVNSQNIALGLNAAAGTVGTNTVAIGTQAAQTNLGSDSVAIGYLTSATRLGSQSTAVGSYAGYNQTGTYNTFIGREAGYFAGSQMTGGNNTYLGYNTSANASNYTNSTAIGTGALITGSSQIKLGNGETVSIPGSLSAAGITCSTINTQNNTISCGGINSSVSTFNLATSTATTLNLGSASTTVSIPGFYANNYLRRGITSKVIGSSSYTTVNYGNALNNMGSGNISFDSPSTGAFKNVSGRTLLLHINASFSFPTNSGGIRMIGIFKNGNSTSNNLRLQSYAAATSDMNISISELEVASNNDYYFIVAFQNSGGNLTIYDNTSTFWKGYLEIICY